MSVSSSRHNSFDSCEKALLNEDLEDHVSPRAQIQKSKRSNLLLAICVHTTIALLYITIIYFYMNPVRSINRTYSPANHALVFENRVFHGELNDTNPYKGPPTPELDAAWHKLLAPTAIRASADDMKKVGRTSIELKDGSGFFVTLDVYHQLHCLKYLRHYVNPDYYTITEPNIQEHVDTLRQYIMCNADVALNTYAWAPGHSRPWPVFTTEHTCVNWEKLHSWAVEHSFDGLDPSLIQNPDYTTVN